MTIVRLIVGLIEAILKVVAVMLTSGIGLLVTGLIIVLVVVALGASGVTGFEALHFLRKRRGGRDDPKT